MDIMKSQIDKEETFTDDQVKMAIESFLEHGEHSFEVSHKGYYSGYGWAARCLRFHLKQIKNNTANEN